MVSELSARSVYHQKNKNSVLDMTAVHRRLLQDPAGWFVRTSVFLLRTRCSAISPVMPQTDKSEYMHWCVRS